MQLPPTGVNSVVYNLGTILLLFLLSALVLHLNNNHETESESSKEKMFSSQGLKFPWESAVSGREVCPEDIYGQQEIHINGDVTLAFQHYLYLTEVYSSIPTHHHWVSAWPVWGYSLRPSLQDLSMFTEGKGSEVIYGVADYWVSRASWSPEDQKYHLLGKNNTIIYIII